MKSPLDEINDLLKRDATAFVRAIHALVSARLSGTASEIGRARDDLTAQLAASMTLADLLGRRRAILSARARARAGGRFAKTDEGDVATQVSPIVPNVTFDEAVEDMAARIPQLARPVDGEPMYQAVARLYREEHAFAAARAVNATVTAKVRTVVKKSLATGRTVGEASDLLASMTGWTRAYSENVYRTNSSTAYGAGLHAQARDPDLRDEFPAFEFEVVGDKDTRGMNPKDKENHLAADGLVAPTGHKVWEDWTPPVGYQCRCGISLVGLDELRRMGALDADGKVKLMKPRQFHLAKGHPEFRGRKVLSIVRG